MMLMILTMLMMMMLMMLMMLIDGRVGGYKTIILNSCPAEWLPGRKTLIKQQQQQTDWNDDDDDADDADDDTITITINLKELGVRPLILGMRTWM